MPRSCMFCSGQPLTNEHVWSNWIRGEVRIDVPLAHELVEEAEGVAPTVTAYSQRLFDQRVRAVCARCNNGWMSRVESAAKPLLEDLLDGRGRRLHRGQQRRLATWALLKAAVFDGLHPRRVAVAAEHRQHLCRLGEPPPSGVWVWLATCDAERPAFYDYRAVELTLHGGGGRPGVPNAYVVTFTIGPVVMQVAGSLVPEIRFDEVDYSRVGAVRIWPASGSVEYRQRAIMASSALGVFASAVYDELMRQSTRAQRRVG